MTPCESFRLVLVAPVYDDAEAAGRLLQEMSTVFGGTDIRLQAVLVDDGSPRPLTEQLKRPDGLDVEVVRLRRNVGHQRAIALGAAYVHEYKPCDALLVMDADGEDRPVDAAKLVARCRELQGRAVVFAERTRRSESLLFLSLYRLYQILHWLLTGIRVRVGNFCVLPAGQLPALVTLPALWNHFAAAIFQARLPRDLVPTERGRRFSGSSKMNFISLFIHGLQAISVFIEIVSVRLLLFIGILALLFNVSLSLALGCLAGHPALTGWLPLAMGGLAAFSIALVLGCFLITLGLLAQRNSLDFIPVRDYRFFIEGLPARLGHS